MSVIDPRFEIVRKTQKQMYWESGLTGDDHEALMDLLGPKALADYLDLAYIEVDKIPSDDPRYETAGLFDRRRRIVRVSREFPREQQRLTGMHEIMHFMLKHDVGRNGELHRDRPIGHLPKQHEVDPMEWEATRIACKALMPEKLVRLRFADAFGVAPGEKLEFDEAAAFRLGTDIEALYRMERRQRILLLVGTANYGRPIVPFHRLFRVSRTAMAIRVEELELVVPDRQRGRPKLRLVR